MVKLPEFCNPRFGVRFRHFAPVLVFWSFFFIENIGPRLLFSFCVFLSLFFLFCLICWLCHHLPLNTSLPHQPINTHNQSHPPNNTYFLKPGQSEPSAPPQEVTCSSPSSTSILVSWVPPLAEFQNGNITGYSIQYSVTEGDNRTSQQVSRIPPESSSYLLENLEKWTEYGITVRALTEAGEGPESLQLLVRTDEDGMFQTFPLPVGTKHPYPW